MTPKKSGPFLTSGQIAEAIQLCIKAAHALYESGLVLNYQGIMTTARALLILAVEEYGKIGWLYRALMLPAKPYIGWREFWQCFRSHAMKNDIGRRMRAARGGLLPCLVPFFRDEFPFWSVTPTALERQKQAMLYVDFDWKSGRFIGPQIYMTTGGFENQDVVEEVEDLVRYIARNNEAHVFNPRVLEAYRELNAMALDEPNRFNLLRLFYGCILRKPTGLAEEKPLDEVITVLRQRHSKDAEAFLQNWIEIGATLHNSA